jgi:hypothetical protein
VVNVPLLLGIVDDQEPEPLATIPSKMELSKAERREEALVSSP